MKTGTDINLTVCREEGYAVVDHGKKPLNTEKDYQLTISDPGKWNSGKVKFGARNPFVFNDIISYKELWNLFIEGGEGIKSFCDFENCPLPSPEENPNFSDFVQLAQTVYYYKGI